MALIAGIYGREKGALSVALKQRARDAYEGYRGSPPYCLERESLLFMASSSIEAEQRTECWLVADGVVDHVAKTAPGPNAAQCIASKYQQGGAPGLTALSGDFAFALWDAVQQRVVCGTDHFGRRPLFYACTEQFFAFSSAPAVLRALPGIGQDVDRSKVAEHLLLVSSDASATFYVGVKRLPAASHLIVSSSQTPQVSRYWAPQQVEAVRYADADDYLDHFEALFQAAVQCRLDHDSTGLMLSGGLDSGAVAQTATGLLSGGRLAAFTSVPATGARSSAPQLLADESQVVRSVSQRLPAVDVTWVRAADRGMMYELERWFSRSGAPPINVYNRLWMERACELAREQSVGTLLTGASGNVTISWHGLDALTDLLRAGHVLQLLRGLKAMSRNDRSRLWWLLRMTCLAPFQPPWLWRTRRSWQRFRAGPSRIDYSLLNPQLARQLDMDDRLDRIAMPEQRPDFWSARRYSGLVGGITLDVQAMNWGLYEAHGLTERDPTSDLHVVEFCLGIPASEFLHSGQSRRLARRLLDRGPLQGVFPVGTAQGEQGADWPQQLRQDWPAVLELVGRLQRSPLAQECLAMEECMRLVRKYPTSSRNAAHDLVYRGKFSRGLAVGAFLLWMEGAQTAKAGSLA